MKYNKVKYNRRKHIGQMQGRAGQRQREEKD
jgi:hypothetical protein